MKQDFRNTTAVALSDKPAGSTFTLDVDADGVPLELYWRKRLADGSVVKANAESSDAAASVPRAAPPKPKKD